MHKILIAVMCSLTGFIIAQQINFEIDNYSGGKAVLALLEGEKISFIDTILLSDEGSFEFYFDAAKNHRGLYRLSLNNNKSVDFIYDNEEVVIETNADNILDSLKIVKSESNRIYYYFIKLNKSYKTKTELLQIILSNYPLEDDYCEITKEKLTQVQEEYLYFINVTAQTNSESFIARYVRSSQLPVINTEIPSEKQLEYLKMHALDNVNFYDDELIYSDAFASKTIEYLTYHRNPQLPKELLEKEFIKAIDSVLNKAKVNEIVYQHIVEYLIDGFENFGFEVVIDYIIENYVIKDDLCLGEKMGDTIERRVQQSRNLVLGSEVPNITLSDSSGNIVELKEIVADTTLIVFYASRCPHCQTLLPQISEVYNQQKEKGIEVLAVSIDTSRTDWLNFVRGNNLNWVNVSDLKGWDGNAAKDYFIYATPTMFLVDKELKLIDKLVSIEDLYN